MAVEVLNNYNRKLVIPDPLPAGNVVAHQIRIIHDNSDNLLPASAGSQRSYQKYPSVTHADFRGDTEYVVPEGVPEYNVVVSNIHI
ncbi:hypothetical protein KUTeg_022420 [Tegillarca granosa]|uniref:Uncharacterized protein n=1 Tax=Tegillarca granosa TaxID=220873 RepID=A0ABQ9E905_TEGGR|nr:hypothetical protein KUTeg_022420 [Tegillarca granosa]